MGQIAGKMIKVLIWGTGIIAEKCTKSLRNNIDIVAYVQSNLDGIVSFKGKKLLPGNLITTIEYDYIILANSHEKEIIESFHLDLKEIVFWREITSEGQDVHGLFQLPDDVYVSFGENCLTDNLLARYDLKTFATPYSHGRSNIEYINAIEKDGFTNFLKSDYLGYFNLRGKTVVRNFYYAKQRNVYDSSVMQGFEFTHHDVIKDEACREKFSRRIKRLTEIKDKILYIFYHHRFCEQTDEKELLKELFSLYARYSEHNKRVFVIMFTQKIVENEKERKVIYELKNGIHIFVFYTLEVWAGTDGEIFWARKDDDLICKMMYFIQEGKLGTCTECFKL